MESPDPYGQFASPYNGMGNDPISGIDPDGGYKSRFGALIAWIASGFAGSIEKSENPVSGYHKFYIDKSNSKRILVDFGNISGKLKDAGAYIGSQGSWVFPDVINPATKLTQFEFWRNGPADGPVEALMQTVVNTPYDTADGVYFLFMNKTISGTHLERDHAFNKNFDGFLTLTTFGYDKVVKSLKTVKSSKPLWNSFQKSTKGLYNKTGFETNWLKAKIYREPLKRHNNMVKSVQDVFRTYSEIEGYISPIFDLKESIFNNQDD